MQTFRDLLVWQKAKILVVTIYKISNSFPKAELYSLTDQIRRAGVSIPSNIAEGYHRKSSKEFYQFLRIAYGSCAELETQLDIAYELQYIDKNDYDRLLSLIQEVEKMLVGLLKKIELSR